MEPPAALGSRPPLPGLQGRPLLPPVPDLALLPRALPGISGRCRGPLRLREVPPHRLRGPLAARLDHHPLDAARQRRRRRPPGRHLCRGGEPGAEADPRPGTAGRPGRRLPDHRRDQGQRPGRANLRAPLHRPAPRGQGVPGALSPRAGLDGGGDGDRPHRRRLRRGGPGALPAGGGRRPPRGGAGRALPGRAGPLSRHLREGRRRQDHRRPRGGGASLQGGPGTPLLSLLLALRHPAHLLRADLMVHPDHRGQGAPHREQPERRLAARPRPRRPDGQLAGESRRLEPLPEPLLGDAAADLDLRGV